MQYSKLTQGFDIFQDLKGVFVCAVLLFDILQKNLTEKFAFITVFTDFYPKISLSSDCHPERSETQSKDLINNGYVHAETCGTYLFTIETQTNQILRLHCVSLRMTVWVKNKKENAKSIVVL